MPRRHLVLVPGFGGFDALGTVRYYPVVMQSLAAWQVQEQNRGKRLELHYFDNLPTAGVQARSHRLLDFLVTLLKTQVIAKDDIVTLVGHSTGGLDIRSVVRTLQGDLDAPLRTADDATVTDLTDPSIVRARDVLAVIRGMVFLSVPQQGTNVANWVRRNRLIYLFLFWPPFSWFTWFVRNFTPRGLLEGLLRLLLEFFGWWGYSSNGVALGLADTLRETKRQFRWPWSPRDMLKLSERLEARSEVKLFLDNIQQDFGAIEDLAHDLKRNEPSRAGRSQTWISPAHLSDAELDVEKRSWQNSGLFGHRIRTMSFATLGKRPFSYLEGGSADSFCLLAFWTWHKFLLRSGWRDSLYLGAYSACATGEFVAQGVGDQELRDIETEASVPRTIAQWDNDGIVNTASMLWPDGARTYLFEGDHGDILGHYVLRADVEGAARTYGSYDIFDSIGPQPTTAGLEEARDALGRAYDRVWDRIFDFAVSDDPLPPPTPQRRIRAATF